MFKKSGNKTIKPRGMVNYDKQDDTGKGFRSNH